MAKKKRTRRHHAETGPVEGDGSFYRIETPCQCQSQTWGERQCQGERGHKGLHWCYNLRGDLEQWPYKKDIRSKYAMAHTTSPPGSKGYVSPADMQKKHYTAKTKWVKIPKPRWAKRDDAEQAKLIERLAKKTKAAMKARRKR